MMPFSKTHGRSPLVMMVFYPALIAAATVIFAGAALAENANPTNRELNCETAPDDCAPLHLCLSDGRSVEGYTTPGYLGRTWLGDISTGGGCLGQLNEEGASAILCIDIVRRVTENFTATVTQAPDDTLSGHGTLPDGTEFDVFGSADPAAEVPPLCVIPLG